MGKLPPNNEPSFPILCFFFSLLPFPKKTLLFLAKLTENFSFFLPFCLFCGLILRQTIVKEGRKAGQGLISPTRNHIHMRPILWRLPDKPMA
jgi:hypothetical protein